MKMVGHQTEAVDLPARLLASFGRAEEEALVVLVVAEDPFLAIAAIHAVVSHTGVLKAQLPRHSDSEIQSWRDERVADQILRYH